MTGIRPLGSGAGALSSPSYATCFSCDMPRQNRLRRGFVHSPPLGYQSIGIKLSAEDEGVTFDQEMVPAVIEEDALRFSIGLRPPSPGRANEMPALRSITTTLDIGRYPGVAPPDHLSAVLSVYSGLVPMSP